MTLPPRSCTVSPTENTHSGKKSFLLSAEAGTCCNLQTIREGYTPRVKKIKPAAGRTYNGGGDQPKVIHTRAREKRRAGDTIRAGPPRGTYTPSQRGDRQRGRGQDKRGARLYARGGRAGQSFLQAGPPGRQYPNNCSP